MPFIRPARFYRFNQVQSAPPPPPPGPAGEFSTFQIFNNEASGLSANFISQSIGLPFNTTDVSGDKYPVFELDAGALSGTQVPYSWWNRVTYPPGHPAAGMWRFAGFVFRVPTSVAASAAVAIRVKSTAAVPPETSRTLAQVSARDFKVVVSGRKGVTGEWFSDIKSGIATPDDVEEFTATASSNGGGNVARFWRIGEEFKQGSVGASAHGGLYAYHYIMALEKADGSLHGYRYLPGICQPFLNSTDTYSASSHGAWKAFETCQAFDGATEITSAPLITRTFTLTNYIGNGKYGSQDIADQDQSRSSNRAFAVKFTTTGELPVNISADATYGAWTGKNVSDTHVSGIGFTKWGPGIAVRTVQSASTFDTQNLDSTGGFGSGAVTVNTLPFIGKGDLLFLCKPNARYNYVSADGTGREAITIPYLDRLKFRSTAVIPPLPVSGSSVITSGSYYWGDVYNAGHLYASESQTGPAPHIGLVNTSHGAHWSSNNGTHYQNVLITGLKAGFRQTMLVDLSSRAFPYVVAGSWPGMGFSWVSASYIPSGIVQSGNGDATRWFGIGNDITASSYSMYNVYGGSPMMPDSSHAATLAHYPYAITGRPEFLDLMYGAATERLVMNIYWGNKVFNYAGRHYTGIAMIMGGVIRDAAWALRDIMSPALFSPTTSKYRSHWLEAVSANVKFEKDLIPRMETFPRANGRMPHLGITSAATNGQPWQSISWPTYFPFAYMQQVFPWTYKLFPSEDAHSVMSVIAKHPKHASTFASGMAASVPVFHYGGLPNPGSIGAASARYMASSIAHTGRIYVSPKSTWDPDTDTIQLSGINGDGSIGGNAYSIKGLSENDQIVFMRFDDLGYTTSAPNPLNFRTAYFLKNVSGQSFQLSETAGGSAVDITVSGSGNLNFTGLFSLGVRGSAAEQVTVVQFEALMHSVYAAGMSAEVCGLAFNNEVSAMVCAAGRTAGLNGQALRENVFRFNYAKSW